MTAGYSDEHRALIPGSVRAVRAWGLGASVWGDFWTMGMGKPVTEWKPSALHPLTRVGLPWHKGENTAICARNGMDFLQLLGEMREPAEAGHTPAPLNCTCGFYARWGHGGSTLHGIGGSVVGVVEMHGLCTVGTRGVRAQKATVLALGINPNIRENYRDDVRAKIGLISGEFGVPFYTDYNAMLNRFPCERPVTS